ncbi:ABC transporter ATP-binding protein [Streptomyces sp. NPDC055036]
MTSAHSAGPAESVLPLLDADRLTVRRTADAAVVLGPVDLRLAPGQVLTVTGPSGAGKSTLLHALLDVVPPGLHRTGGTVGWRGAPVRPGSQARRWRRDRCGWLGQDPGATLNPLWRVGRLIGEELEGDKTTRVDRVHAMLDLLGLSPQLASRHVGELSGGQAQRVALARALCTDPELLVLDEPTSAMDRDTASLVIEAVRSRRGTPGRCVLLVTHDERLAAELGDATLRLEPPVGTPVRLGPTHSHRGTSPVAHPSASLLPARVRRNSPATASQPIVAGPPTAVLSVRSLRLTDPGGAPLLDSGDLDLPAGGAIAVMGPSGSGKTTLLHALTGRRPAAAGQLLLHGRHLPAETGRRERGQLRAVQLVGQSPLNELNPAHRAGWAVARPLMVLHGLDRAAAREQARALLEAVGLDPELGGRRPRMLSGGQRQRIVLARALAARPDVLLLDEPTASLDGATAHAVLDLLDRLRTEGLALLTVTHDPRVAEWSDHVVHLTGERLVPAPSVPLDNLRNERTDMPGAR